MEEIYTFKKYMETSKSAEETLYCFGDFELSRIKKSGNETYYLIEKITNDIPVSENDIFYRITESEFNIIAQSFKSKSTPIIIENHKN